MGNHLPCCNDDANSAHGVAIKRHNPVAQARKSIISVKPMGPKQQSEPTPARWHIQSVKEQRKGRGPEQYQCVRCLGKGSYGVVVLAEQKASGKRFAMKIIPKSKINEVNLLQSKLIPAIRGHSFLTHIVELFQNEQNVYIVMEYLAKGDLYFYSKKQELLFSETMIRDVLAEIVVAVCFLHTHGIVYRQLKPQNILLTEQGHVKLTDYGLSKILVENDLEKGVSTFFGSLEYMAPEIVSGTFDQRADLWAVGVLIYELKFKQNLIESEGQSKYSMKEYKEMLQNNFIEERINSKIGHMSFQFRDVLFRLLEKDPAGRICMQDLKMHAFFEGVDWAAVENRQNEAPFAELLKKGDYIKFRDPTTQPKYRLDILQKHSKHDYFSLQLCQIRNSQ